MKKTVDNVDTTKIKKGMPIKAIDIIPLHLQVLGASQNAIAMGIQGFKDAQANVMGGGAHKRTITGRSAWVRCLALESASPFSAMQIVGADLVCAEVRLLVRKADKPAPKNGAATICTNDLYALQANRNGWVRFVSYTDGPVKLQVVKGAPPGRQVPKL